MAYQDIGNALLPTIAWGKKKKGGDLKIPASLSGSLDWCQSTVKFVDWGKTVEGHHHLGENKKALSNISPRTWLFTIYCYKGH